MGFGNNLGITNEGEDEIEGERFLFENQVEVPPMTVEEAQKVLHEMSEKIKLIFNEISLGIAEKIMRENFPDGIISQKPLHTSIDFKIEYDDVIKILEKVRGYPSDISFIK